MSDVQRWTSNSVAPSDAGGFVAYGDYLELCTKLAESQARELRMREALAYYTDSSRWKEYITFDMNPLDRMVTLHPEKSVAEQALTLPQDDSALREMIEAAKAEEREACAQLCEQWNATHPERLAAAIRAMKEKDNGNRNVL